MTEKNPRQTKRERVNMRIPADLLEWARGYAYLKRTTLTNEYIKYLENLRKSCPNVKITE